jgi:hypothetical protein
MIFKAVHLLCQQLLLQLSIWADGYQFERRQMFML